MHVRSYNSLISSIAGLFESQPRNAVQQSSSLLCFCSSSKDTMICWSALFCCLKRLQSLIQSNNPLPRPSLLRMRCLRSVTVISPAIDRAKTIYMNNMSKTLATRDYILEVQSRVPELCYSRRAHLFGYAKPILYNDANERNQQACSQIDSSERHTNSYICSRYD